MGCIGDCRQGRGRCESPQACSLLVIASARCREQLGQERAAAGARLAGAWPYTGTPTAPGKLTEAELEAQIASKRPALPLAVNRAGQDQHPAEAISGPHTHGLGWLDRLVWRLRVWRADRMWPRGVQR